MAQMSTVDTAKSMATPEGQARNEKVFRTAARLMVQKGYGATSISDIATAVGMTKAGLYHHIRSKQDMLFQILHYAMENLDRVVIEPTRGILDPEERLRETIRMHIHGLFDHGLEMVLLFPERRHLEPAQQQAITQQIERYLSHLRKTLEELKNEEKLRDLDIDITSRHILQTIAGIARWYTKDVGISMAQLVEQTVNFNLSAILKD